MKLNSLGLQTELIFAKFDGEVQYKENYIVIKTPSNPNYYWGNSLIFNHSPKDCELDKWEKIFKKELTDPKIYHLTFAWDNNELGSHQQFIDSGYKLEKSVVLTTNKIKIPKKYNQQIKIKTIETENEWEEVINTIALTTQSKSLSFDKSKAFAHAQALRYQKMIQFGVGKWFGAFINEKLVGSLGVFKDQNLVRYQLVNTHPEFQRMGICGTLVFETAKYALEQMNAKNLVMIADEEYHAAKIYESVGFNPTENFYGFCKITKS